MVNEAHKPLVASGGLAIEIMGEVNCPEVNDYVFALQ